MFAAVKSPFNSVAIRVVIVGLGVPCMAAAEDTVANALERCGLIDDDGARLVCYDGISGRVSSPSSSMDDTVSGATLDAAATVAMPSAAPVKKIETQTNTASQKTRTARVTGCSKNVSDQVVFYLDNGEVWKQSNYKRLQLGECDFAVTLTRGLMGYKMRQEGTGREFRVSRVK